MILIWPLLMLEAIKLDETRYTVSLSVCVFVFVFIDLCVCVCVCIYKSRCLCLSFYVCLSMFSLVLICLWVGVCVCVLFVFWNLRFCVCLYRLVCLYLWLSLSVCVSVFVFKTQLSKDTIFRVSIETNYHDDIMTRFFVWTTVSQVWTFLAAAYIVIVPLFEEVTQPTLDLIF